MTDLSLGIMVGVFLYGSSYCSIIVEMKGPWSG